MASQSAADLFLPIDQLGAGLELRFRRGAGGELCFVSIYEGEIPAFEGNPSLAEVWILTEGAEPIQRIGTRLEGGHRMIIDETTAAWLFEMVQDEIPFELRLRSHHYCEMGYLKLKKRLAKWGKLKADSNS